MPWRIWCLILLYLCDNEELSSWEVIGNNMGDKITKPHTQRLRHTDNIAQAQIFLFNSKASGQMFLLLNRDS